MTVEAEARVCPECGQPAGEAPFCGGCGVNLSSQVRLPTRAEWEALRYSGRPPESVAPGVRMGRWRPRPLALWGVGALLVVAGVAAALVLLNKDNGKTDVYTVPSEAMAPTYQPGDRISVNLDAYSNSEPNVGDVVVFHPPAGADNGIECGTQARSGEPCAKPTFDESTQVFLKRIVAGPGDTLAIRHGLAVVNGRLQPESFADSCGASTMCDMPRTITIAPDQYFMLGDNRGASDDSRFWGPVPARWILGKVE